MGLAIAEIAVEGGFLDGLNLSFRDGLNVLIGPRGAGKTSVIELLRFALGIGNVTEEAGATSRQHALSVLGEGRVTVTLTNNGDRLVFSRTAADESPSLLSAALPASPLILAQGEIERIGLDAAGRLRLIDAFLDAPERALSPSQLSLIRSQTAQIQEVEQEIATLRERVVELPEAREELQRAEKEEELSRSSVAAVTAELTRLDEISAQAAADGVRRQDLDRATQAVRAWEEEITRVAARAPRLESAEAESDGTALADARRRIAAAAATVERAAAELEEVVADLDRRRFRIQTELDTLNAEAVELRRRIESIQEGAGAAARRLAQLRERVVQLESLKRLAAEREATAEELRRQRAVLLDKLDAQRRSRYDQRAKVADFLNTQLGPTVKVEVERGAGQSAYASALAGALRGSGIQYTALAPSLANQLSPRELVEAVEADDVALVTAASGITTERGERLLRHLRSVGVEDILAAPVEDGVGLLLWDGADYRSTQHLSTGQRCTVVLPILLLHRDRPVVIDQPEDNLDNHFIVKVLVGVLAQLDRSGQVIAATHNPNIPVLGDAAYVVELDSDGRRGFCRTQGTVDDPPIVDAVTTVMEGGREAFERRAAFYGVI